MTHPRKIKDVLGRRGVVAIEFAIIAPVLALMIIGAYDVSSALFCWQQTVTASNMVALSAQVLVAESIQSTTTPQLSTTQATQAMTAAYAALPWLRQGTKSNYSVSLSGVLFTANPPGSSTLYTANLMWSVGLSPALLSAMDSVNTSPPNNPIQPTSALQVISRIKSSYANAPLTSSGSDGWCGEPISQVFAVPNTAATLNVIPTQLIQTPGTVLIADVFDQYIPIFPGWSFVASGIDFWATSLVAPPIGATNVPVWYDQTNYMSDSAVCSAQGYQ